MNDWEFEALMEKKGYVILTDDPGEFALFDTVGWFVDSVFASRQDLINYVKQHIITTDDYEEQLF